MIVVEKNTDVFLRKIFVVFDDCRLVPYPDFPAGFEKLEEAEHSLSSLRKP